MEHYTILLLLIANAPHSNSCAVQDRHLTQFCLSLLAKYCRSALDFFSPAFSSRLVKVMGPVLLNCFI